MTALKGILGYLVTPFGKNGLGIDADILRITVDHLIEGGVHGVAPLGSTGESANLTDDEWREVVEVTISQVAGRVPTVVGVSALTTEKTTRFAALAEELGADALMVLPISYWKLSEDEILTHYAAVSEAVSLPIMAYNNPATSGIDMSPELLVRMVMELENVTMVKESSGDIQRMHALRELSDDTIPFFNGCNPLALEALCAGAGGWCTAAPNLIAGLNIALWEAVCEDRLDDGRECFYKQLPILRFILSRGLPATVKAALRLQGIDAGTPRLPLKPLDEEAVEELAALMAAAGS
jgi:4-hydroxy-tetrahydrodipicolinate synthase